jgi:hypothetical protein
MRLRRFLAFRGSAGLHSYTVSQEIGGRGVPSFSASEEGKGCSFSSSINKCAPTEGNFLHGLSAQAGGAWRPASENPDLHPTDEDLSVGTPDLGHRAVLPDVARSVRYPMSVYKRMKIRVLLSNVRKMSAIVGREDAREVGA